MNGSVKVHLLVAALLLFSPLTTVADVLEGPARLDGHWKLDWDRSDSFKPVMKALEVNWLLRQLAGVARVGLELQALPAECETCPGQMLVTLSTPLSSDEVHVILDGTPRPGKDPRGRPTQDAYTWSNEGGMEMIRKLELPSGSQARLRETRNLGSDPDTLISTLTVWVDGAEQASVHRTFERTDD